MSSQNEICAVLGGAADAYGFSVSETQLAQLARYVAMTMSWARIANLTGATNALAFAREQVVDCLAVVCEVMATDSGRFRQARAPISFLGLGPGPIAAVPAFAG